MKLNYREKIILGCFLAVAILLGAFLGLVKPKTKTLKDNQARLEELNTEKEGIENKINQIAPLKTKINDIYNETNKLAEVFVPSDDVNTPTKLDKMLQKYADENNVKIYALDAGTTAVSTLGYYYFQAKDDAKKYREEYDLGGQLQQQYDEENKIQKALDDREVETVFETKYGIRVNGTKEDIFNYLKAIAEFDEAMTIKSVQISDYSFGQDAIDKAMEAGAQIAEALAPQEEEVPAEGEEAEEEQPAETEEETEEAEHAAPISITVDGKEITNTSDCQIVISVYSVYDIPEPNVDYVPEA